MDFLFWRKLIILFSIHSCYRTVNGQETNEEIMPTYEYLQIFRSIPTLFEYLLNMLETNPEILERNDITYFSRAGDASYEESKKKRDVATHHFDSNHAATGTELERNKAHNKARREIDNFTDPTTVAYEYGNSNVAIKLTKNDNKKLKRNIDVKSQGVKGHPVSKINMKSHKNKKKEESDVINRVEKFIGTGQNIGYLNLKPDEVVEQIITVDELLEEHNDKK